MTLSLQAVDTALRRQGLALRGAFHPEPEDAVPPWREGIPARTLCLAGNRGGSLWSTFSRSNEYREGIPDPLDTWSRRVLEDVAARLGARALFPFGGPPFLPFLRWAQRAEDVHPSVMGPLIHPELGLWHAYRGALVFGEELPLPETGRTASPCDRCPDRPCLGACPVAAVRPGEFAVDRCAAHLVSHPRGDCASEGCLARRACPVGREHAYGPEQARFHLARFAAAWARRQPGGEPERARER